MTHKFNKPCIMDVKIGRKSYDPFASSEKIQQQVSKYPLMEEIGFLVLGMRVRVILSIIYIFLLHIHLLKIIDVIIITYQKIIYFGIGLSVTPLCMGRDFYLFYSLIFGQCLQLFCYVINK